MGDHDRRAGSAGADAVVMLEHVERDGEQASGCFRRGQSSAGDNIVAQGAQARKGDELLPAGTVLGPAQIALAAACGYAALDVFARPRVAILTTGDELVPVDAEPGPGQIRNSNAPMLAALVAAAGGEPWVLPTAADSDEALDAALARGARDADLLLISGGVSAGKFDLVEPALARLGARFHFTGVRIQPGKPLVFGELPRGTARVRAERAACVAVLRAARQSHLFGGYVSAVCRAGAGGAGGRRRIRPALRAGAAGRGHRQARQAGADALSAGALRLQPAGAGSFRRLKRCRGTAPAIWRLLRGPTAFWLCPKKPSRLEAGAMVRILLHLRNPMPKSAPVRSSRISTKPARPRMVDVSAKQATRRTATASAFVELSAAVLAALPENPKGNPLEVARFAGIQAAKRTAELIPMCHPLALTHVDVQAEIADGRRAHYGDGCHGRPHGRGDGGADRRCRGRADGLRHDQGAG